MLKRFYRSFLGFLERFSHNSAVRSCDFLQWFSASVYRLQELHCFVLTCQIIVCDSRCFSKLFSPLVSTSVYLGPSTHSWRETAAHWQTDTNPDMGKNIISTYCINVTYAHSVPGQQSCINVLFLEVLLTGQAPYNNIIQTLKPVGG